MPALVATDEEGTDGMTEGPVDLQGWYRTKVTKLNLEPYELAKEIRMATEQAKGAKLACAKQRKSSTPTTLPKPSTGHVVSSHLRRFKHSAENWGLQPIAFHVCADL